MTHEEAAHRLTEWLGNALADGEASEVERHAAECAECGMIVETIRLLNEGRAALPSGDSAASAEPTRAHPSTPEIALYAAVPEQLTTTDLARIGAHLAECRSCSDEVALIRRADAEVRPRRPSSLKRLWQALTRGEGRRMLALAALFVVLVAAYPAWLGFVRLPAVSREAEALRGRADDLEHGLRALSLELDRKRQAEASASPPEGLVTLNVLSEPTRSGSAPANLVRVANGQHHVPIVVAPEIDETLADTEEVVFEIVAPGAVEPTWKVLTSAGALREEMRRSKVVAILAPSRALKVGPHRLVLRLAGSLGASTAAILDVGFDVVAPASPGSPQRQSPTATNAPQ